MNDSKETNEQVCDSEPSCLIELTRGYKTIVSKIDYDYLNQWNWCAMGRYAARSGRATVILMHRVIAERMEFNIAMKIKHKDKNPLNNRRSNLFESGIPVPRKRRSKRKT